MNRHNPYIDPDVHFVGVSKLRGFTADRLRTLTGAYVFQDANDCPLCVLLPYATYLAMQEQLLDETPPPQETR
jgi:hypothetical protein